MDPNAAWLNLVEALSFDDIETASEYALALIQWLDNNGFPPNTLPTQLPANWDRLICYSVCQQVISSALQNGA